MINQSIPEITRVIDYYGGETVQIFGENLSEKSKMYWWRPSFDQNREIADCGKPCGLELPATPPENAICHKAFNVVNNQVLYISADERVRGGTAVIWIETEEGISAPFVVNPPRIYSQSVEKIYPGGILSLFGDNFGERNFIYFKNIATGELVASAVFVNDCYRYYSYRYNASIRIPKDIADGEYEVYLNNGCGGSYGWSEPVKLKVDSSYTLIEYYATKWNRDAAEDIPVPAGIIKAVPANILGANVDMTDEIQTAIDEAHAAGGGTVVLSSGIYGISKTINIKSGVVLQGAGKGATTIKKAIGCDFSQDWDDVVFASSHSNVMAAPIDWRPHWLKHKIGALIRIIDNAGVEELRLELGGANIGVLVANTSNEEVKNAFVNYVEVDGGVTHIDCGENFGEMCAGFACVSNTRNLTLFKNSFTAFTPISVLPSLNHYAKLIGNKFICSPRQLQESYVCGMFNSMICQNDFIGGRRSLMMQGCLDNNWIYQNRSKDVARSGNALEVYMSEHGESDWTGKASAFAADYIEIDGLSEIVGDIDVYNLKNLDDRRIVCIINGRGLGQYRRLDRVEGNRIYLDKPWNVMPDENTAYTLATATLHNMWIDNNATLSNGHSEFLWNCGLENIMAGHYIDLAAGIRIYSNCYHNKENRTCVMAYNKIVHCQIRASGEGIWLNSDGNRIVEKKPDYVVESGGGMFGNSVRQNLIDGMRSMQYTKNLEVFVDFVPHCGIAVGGAYNTVCSNRIGGYTTAIMLLDSCKGNCIENNIYDGNDVNIRGNGQPIGNDIRISHYDVK